ncbi:hypothetical protein J3E69DRAFT_256702 [Trichoderma sp. SZMC 28015]
MRETPTRVLGFWIQAMAGDRLTPVLSLILIKPKGGKRLRPAHLVYEKQPSAGVALAGQAVALFGHKQKKRSLLGERRDMGEGGRLPNIGQALSPLRLSPSLSGSCPFSPLHLDCRRGQAWTTEQCTNLHSLCAVVLVQNRPKKLSHIINPKTTSRSGNIHQSSPGPPAAPSQLGHDAMGGFTFCTWLRSCSKGGAAAFMQREWITRFLLVRARGRTFPLPGVPQT